MSTKLLEGKKGIIFGALDNRSIAWKVAEKAHEHGAQFTLTNTAMALRMGTLNELGEQTNSPIIAADATDMDELTALYQQSMEALGGKIDFVLHSIGMSPNVRKKRAYTDLNYAWLQKTMDISALSFHKVMQAGYQLDAFNEWASVLGLSYIAAQRTFPGYGDMADAKSTLESIARSFGYYLGKEKKVRVNTISQSPTITSAGSGIKGFDGFFNYAEKLSPLGNADADSCADYCVVMFSDLSRMVTMQNLFHDGGFSSTGVSDVIMDLVMGDQG
ncbi:MAG: SDR family oxidoreductase [Saprospiraceae bacterium]|nr:SDR family oxidoreductase [Saprospiraceae bacterium]